VADATGPEASRRLAGEGTRYLAFEVGGDRFALPLTSVHTVLRPGPVTPVPFTPPTVLGVIALRGAIVPLLDLARGLGTGETAPGPETRFLVVDHEGCLAALVVGRLQEVIRVSDEDHLPELDDPLVVRPAAVRQLLRLEGRVYGVLDPARLADFFRED
jgi:purine-binding chemotaxis protein CheW